MNVLVTGASAGFGKLTVEKLLSEGHQVVASMRNVEGKNKDSAKELTDAGAHVVELDVTDDKSVVSGVEKAVELVGDLDAVVNNAGIGVLGWQELFTPEDWQKLFDVNVFGVQRVNRAVIPHMRERGSGVLVHVSSLLGRIVLPFYGPYNASKWALEAMAQNYRYELSGFGIDSVIVEPGGFPTSFMDSLLRSSDDSQNEAYGEMINVPQKTFEGFEQTLASNPAQNPQNVADAIAKVIAMPAGQRPMRTIVDAMGMGDPVEGYNEQLDQIHAGLYDAFGMSDMLQIKSSAKDS